MLDPIRYIRLNIISALTGTVTNPSGGGFISIYNSKNQSAFDLSAYNFNCYAVQNSGIQYLEDDLTDHTYFRAILELSNKVEQTN